MDELTQYYYSIYPGLVSAMEAEGIDPRWAGIVAPQVMIETSWGKSPATKYHNYFGMKAAKNQNGVIFSTNEGYGDDTIRIGDSFLAFPSREEGLRQGVRRLRDKFNAFEGKPSTEQYVKNINSNPEQIYFTGNPEDYINNINSIKNGSRAKAAIKQYAKDVRNTFLEAQSTIPNPSEDSRIEKPQPIFTPRGDVKKAMQDKVDYHNFMNSISIQNNPQPTYNPPMKFDDGGELYHPKQWNDLTMAEKAEMMKVAVQNGITTLPEIKERYNEFAKGGYVPSDRIKDRITHYEGKAMTGAIDPLSGKYSKNNSFESEAKGFYNALPEDIRDQVLSNPELADSLYSYSYNVGAGNFKKRVVPTLRRYYQGNATVSDIERSMWASGDSKLRGLQRRRAEERAGVRSALAGNNPIYPTMSSESESLPFTPFYNEVFNTPLSSYNVPTVTLPIEEPLVQTAEDYAYSKEALDRQERQNRLNAFNMLLSMSNPNSTGNSLMDTVGMLTRNNRAYRGNLFEIGGPKKKWKALDNIEYKAIPDTTFTKERTGAGSIEYFPAEHPEGIIYNNGYYKPHPNPGNDVILYNPKENDAQDIRLDALHIMPKDATYDALNTLYRNAALDSDVSYNAKKKYDEDVKKYGKDNVDSYEQYYNNEADGLLRNMFIEGTPEYIKSKRYYPNKSELRDWNKRLLPYIDNIQNYLETGQRPSNILPEVTVIGKKKQD